MKALDAALVLLVVLLAVLMVWALARFRRLRAAERERRLEIETLQAVEDDRAKGARELHELVSRAVNGMLDQAAGAKRLVRHDAAQAEQALDRVETTGEQAMSELRHLLSLLRSGANGAPPGIGTLSDLVEDFRQGGMPVWVEISGDPGRLAPATDHTAYRIIHESLINAARQAGHGPVHVRVSWEDSLVLEILDTCGEDPHLSTVQGLLALSERVAALGGTFRADTTPDGYRVSAVLPREDRR